MVFTDKNKNNKPNYLKNIKNFISKMIDEINIKFRLVKSLDIAYVTLLFFIFSFYFASLTDHLFFKLFGSSNNPKNYIVLLLEISLQIAVGVGVLSYIIRNIVQLFPYPFNGYYKYDRSRMNELIKGSLISTFLILFQTNLQAKITNLKNYATQYFQEANRRVSRDISITATASGPTGTASGPIGTASGPIGTASGPTGTQGLTF